MREEKKLQNKKKLNRVPGEPKLAYVIYNAEVA